MDWIVIAILNLIYNVVLRKGDIHQTQSNNDNPSARVSWKFIARNDVVWGNES